MTNSFDRWHLAGALAVICLAVTGQSLWIDEAFTWSFASEPSWMTFFHRLHADVNSDAQMPGFLILAKALLPVLGSTEYALRAINLVWGWAAIAAMWGFFRATGHAWLTWIFALHPFLWFYMDEARPYVAQMAGGAGVLCGLTMAMTSKRLELGTACLIGGSLLVLCVTTLTGVFPAFAAWLGLIWLICRKKVAVSKPATAVLAISVIFLLALGFYYLQTALHGAAGARHWKVGPGNILFCFYEWGGFAGAGPQRTVLREAATQGVSAIAIALTAHTNFLCILAAAWLATAWNGWLNRRNLNQSAILLALALIGIAVLTGLLGFMIYHFPFWGRHFAAAVPWIAAASGLLVAARPAEAGFRRSFSLIATLLLLGSLGTSSAALRWDESQRKEDYRWAAEIAKKNLREGKTVWWLADAGTAKYYEVPAQAFGRPSSATPDLIIISRPDLFDPAGEGHQLAVKLSYQPITRPGFAIWEKPTP